MVNGDLFDFWFEYGSVVPRGHTRTLGLLAEVVDSGTPVVLFGGNHDWWGGSYLRNEIGVEFRAEPAILDLAGWRTLLAHGDGVGDGDLGYRVLRAIIRSRPARWAFRWLHPDVGARIARGVSLTEGRPAHSPSDNARAEVLARWAEQRLETDPGLDLVALGHTHVPELRRMEGTAREGGRPGYYVNSGDWVHHSTYVVLEEGAEAPRMMEWPLAEGGRSRENEDLRAFPGAPPQRKPDPHVDAHGTPE